MTTIKAYAKAAHFGPTMLITTISFLLATQLWWEGPAYVIAFTVFLGQLIIGWSNDIYDYQDDLTHNRQNKPLVNGHTKYSFTYSNDIHISSYCHNRKLNRPTWP